METLTLKITGMTCGGCVSSVSNVLNAITGVSEINVSLEKNCATIHFDPALASYPKFKAAIENAGFDIV
jgi:copper chaperone